MPHGFCLLWRPDILALHAISDLLIAGAYFSIPLAILSFVRRRANLAPEHKRVAVLFSVFILACGMTHVMAVVTLWRPLYVQDGLIKAFTALVSLATAVTLWPMLPRLLETPSPAQLALANSRLRTEVEAKEAALAELETIRAGLEAEVTRRTQEVQALARRFEIATAGSSITVSEQDSALRYTWLHNRSGRPSRDPMGLTDEDLLGPSAAQLTLIKRQVLATGKAARAEIMLPIGGDAYHFDLNIAPARVGDGDGLVTAAVDITEQKEQQAHLQVILRELAHRAKNLLALVQGIARQTAKAENLPKGFAERFGERLSALGAAYDLLIGDDWRGVDLGALVQAQIAHMLPVHGGRILIEGPPVMLTPEAGQYLALALHELATNAIKHGVLGSDCGELSIQWTRSEAPDGMRTVSLSWTEQGAPPAAPEHSGFGRLLLETLVPRALKGAVERTLDADGLRWQISFHDSTAAFQHT
jgi:two-component sensor histidine kinase